MTAETRVVAQVDKTGEIVKKKIEVVKKSNKGIGESLTNINVGFYLITPLLAGVFLGIFLDSTMHTKPLFLIACIIIGSIATFYNLYRLVNERDTSH